jgi:hypothetical protein
MVKEIHHLLLQKKNNFMFDQCLIKVLADLYFSGAHVGNAKRNVSNIEPSSLSSDGVANYWNLHLWGYFSHDICRNLPSSYINNYFKCIKTMY